MSHKEILRIENLEKHFGGLKALNKINLTINEGEIIGLVGPNGSGKTTLINVISGIYKPSAGRIYFYDKRIDSLPAYKISHIGINRTFQIPKPFHGLTVRENVELAALYSGKQCFSTFIKNLPKLHLLNKGYCNVNYDVDQALSIVDLLRLQNEQAINLNSSQQKLLGLARALATKPKLLLVDEIAAGLSIKEDNSIANLLIELAKQGISLIVVEHLLHFIKKLASRVIVMESGEKIFEGSIEQASNDEHVVRAFLGG